MSSLLIESTRSGFVESMHHVWPTEGYERAGHPVQERIREEVAH